MCHLILALPVLGTSVFWLMPFKWALPVYILILLLSGLIYYKIMVSMSDPVTTGIEGLIGQTGKFLGFNSTGKVVNVHGEIWNAYSSEQFKPGDNIKVIDVNGLTLKVKRKIL